MKSWTFIVMATLLLACNAPAGEKNAAAWDSAATGNRETDSPAEEAYEGCYQRVLQRDTVLLRLFRKGNAVSGTLRFDNYEKDATSGTVEGIVKDGRLVLWYAFLSEGMRSVSEVVLKKEADGLTMGTGDIIMSGDTAVFREPGALTFDKAQRLVRVACK